MSASRVGRLLLALGLLVGVAAVVGLFVGFEPARLPGALLNIAAYKLSFVAALGLLAAGAMVSRNGRREATRGSSERTPGDALGQLGAPARPRIPPPPAEHQGR